MAPKKKAHRSAKSQAANSYQYETAESPMRPDPGTKAQFRKRTSPMTYRCSTSLDPAPSWHEGNESRRFGRPLQTHHNLSFGNLELSSSRDL